LLGAWCVLTGRSLRFDRRQHAYIALQGALLFGFKLRGRVLGRALRDVRSARGVVFPRSCHDPVGARWLFGTPLTLRTLVAAVLGVVGVALMFVAETGARGAQSGSGARQSRSGLGATVIASAGKPRQRRAISARAFRS
jgi:hypothetical protein